MIRGSSVGASGQWINLATVTDGLGQTGTVLSLPARVTAGGRWSSRLALALVPAAGGAVLVVAAQNRDQIPWAVWLLGVVVVLLGVWMETDCWRAGQESLSIGPDRSLRVHSPTLLTRDLVVEASNVSSVRLAEPVNVPAQAVVLTFFTHGDFLRIDLVEPLQLRESRFSNYLWALRETRDPWPVPLPHRTVRSLGFIADRADVERAVALLEG